MKNNEHALDITVRQALENLEIPFNADHWELMVGKFDMLDVVDAEFDKNLASKLSTVEIPYTANHWDLMIGKLDMLDAKDAEFDKNLASKLSSMEVPYIPAHWADMSDRLNSLDNSETSFDALLRQHLDNIVPNMPENHWDLMEEKIEETFSWRRKIVRYKVVEVALVFLTLFTVANALDLPFDSVRSTSNNDNANPKIETTIKKTNLKKATPEKAKETKSFYNPTDWRNRPTTPNKNENKSAKPVVSVDNKKGDAVSNAVAVVEVETAAITASNPVRNTEGGAMRELPLRKILAIGKITDGLETPEDVATIAATTLKPMDVLKPSLLNTQIYDGNVIYPKSKDKKPKWRLNTFVLPIADWVGANSIQFREKVAQKQTVANLGTGIAAAYKKDKLEVEIGLSYLDKKYDLPNVEVTTGSFLRGYNKVKLQNLHLSIASIPLSVNYVAKETRRWTFYTRMGAAVNTILKSDQSQFVTTNGATNVNDKPNFDVFEPNVYPKGITEKGFFKIDNWFRGNLKNNSYLTANAGVGVEYRLTNKTDIYFQPTVDYHFGHGIGTLNDRIHSFSVQGGVKTKLR